MVDYIDGKNILSMRPEPGRPLKLSKSRAKVIKETKLDVDGIANAVIKAIEGKMSVNYEKDIDSFNTSSLDKIAKAMIIEREDKESNLRDLGRIKTTQKDVDKTVNMLRDIE